MRLTQMKINPRFRDEGAWVRDIPDLEGVSLKVKGEGNPEWMRILADAFSKVPPRTKRLPPEIASQASRDVLFDALLDWDGFTDDEGNPLPFDKESAKALFDDDGYEPFRIAVAHACRVVANEGVERLEEDRKN